MKGLLKFPVLPAISVLELKTTVPGNYPVYDSRAVWPWESDSLLGTPVSLTNTLQHLLVAPTPFPQINTFLPYLVFVLHVIKLK